MEVVAEIYLMVAKYVIIADDRKWGELIRHTREEESTIYSQRWCMNEQLE